MKKIFVNYTGRTGGCALYAYEMTKALSQNRECEITAVISKQAENIDKWKELEIKNLYILDTYTNKINFICNTLKFIFYKRYKLKKEFEDEVFDAIYVPAAPIWTPFINSIIRKKKLIITVHDAIDHSGTTIIEKLLTYYNKKDLYNSNKIIVLSKMFVEYVSNKYKKGLDDIIVIPQAALDFYSRNKKVKSLYIYNNDNVNFLFFGRIEHYKGINVLLDAYKIIEKKYNNVSLTIVGDGDLSSYKEKIIELRDKKIINRWIKDEEVSNFFDGKNVISVLPYLDATQSGVVNLAMAESSLVIVSNTGALTEQVIDGKTGLVVEAGNVYSLVEAMEYVINNPDVRKKIVKNANEYINSLSWDKLAGRVFDAI